MKTVSTLLVLVNLLLSSSFLFAQKFPPPTNGTVLSYNPLPPQPPIALGTAGPYIDGVDKAGKIENICSGQSTTITAVSSTLGLGTYQWYVSTAIYNKFTRQLEWSPWSAISGATNNGYSVSFSSFQLLELHKVYFCIYTPTKQSQRVTSVIGISKASTPVIRPLIVQASYVCPGQNIVVVPDFDVSGDQTDIFWERSTKTSPNIWARQTGSVDPFSFPSNSYFDSTYDYRLAIVHSCVNYRSTSLRNMPLQVTAAFNESFVSPSSDQATKTVCIHTQTDFTAIVSPSNSFHTYTNSWEYQLAGTSTWTKITAANAGSVFRDYTTLSLKVTPNSEIYHNMKLRCTSIGACRTIVSNQYTLLLKVPPVITGIQSSVETACVGQTITLSAVIQNNPLSTPVQYRWRVDGNIAPGQFFSADNATFTFTMPATAKTFTCEVQNGAQCVTLINSFSKAIPVFSNPNISINVTSTGCGGSTADLFAEVTQGKTPYVYSWNTGATTQSITNQPANETYTITVTDACGLTASKTTQVSSLPQLQLEVTKQDVLCATQANGRITSQITGGVAPYFLELHTLHSLDQYELLHTISDTLSGQITFTSLSSGTYRLTIADACDSIKQTTIIIGEPEQLQAIISESTPVSCFNGGNGSARVQVSGGVHPYVINWISGQRTELVQGLFAGTYIANVSDNNGCHSAASTIITQPQAFDIEVLSASPSCNALSDGYLNILPKFGAMPYTVTVIFPDGSTHNEWEYTNIFAGTYTIEAIDSCGFTILRSITITQPQALTYTLESQNISCFGRTDGTATISYSGGVGPFSILWQEGQITNSIANLSTGYYSVTLEDACISIKDSIFVHEPDSLIVEISSFNITCNGALNGEALALVSGGTQPYSFNWSNGRNTQFIRNLNSGRYSIHVSDAQGCSIIQSVDIIEPERLTASIQKTDVLCYGDSTGSISVVAQYGALPYRFEWDNLFTGSYIEDVPAGTYTLVVRDDCDDSVKISTTINQPQQLNYSQTVKNITCYGMQNGEISVVPVHGVAPYSIEWEQGLSGFHQTELPAQVYTYTIYDHCNDSIVVETELTQPDLFNLSLDVRDVSCNGLGNGSAIVTPIGGKSPYIYRWNIGVQTSSVQGLFPGLYTVNVYDNNGCFASETFEITEPSPLAIDIEATPTLCNKEVGQAFAVASGGSIPYSFYWSTEARDDHITGLAEGTYTAEVTDSKGCKVSQNTTISVYTPNYPICLVTIDRYTGKNKVVWEKVVDSDSESVNIYKMMGGVFRWIGSSHPIRESFFDDDITDPRVSPSRYAITSVDACGNESAISAFHQTIHLGASPGIDGSSVVLDWTDYIDESQQFKPTWYYLYRGTEPHNLILFDSVDARVASEYNDVNPQASKYYKVGVKKDAACITTGILKAESGPFTLAMSNIAEAETEISTHVLEIEERSICTIYPNPSYGKFTIEMLVPEQFFAEISTMNGQVVWQQEISEQAVTVTLQDYPIGVYTLLLYNNNEWHSYKLVIQ